MHRWLNGPGPEGEQIIDRPESRRDANASEGETRVRVPPLDAHTRRALGKLDAALG